MRLSPLRRSKSALEPGVTGTVRLDKRTSKLTKRLRPGEIAVIDHVDIDRASAEALVACRVAAVVNVSESISGRYPNLGPEIIAAAGIPLIDSVGSNVFATLDEGDTVRIEDGVIHRGDAVIGQGEVFDAERILELMDQARAGMTAQLEAFTANTMEYLRRERSLLIDGVGVPDVHTKIEGRHVLIVVRGYDYRRDLESLRGYIRQYRPVLCGVDGGADALMEAGHTPDIIIGDMEEVSDKTLRCGAELVVHSSRDGTCSRRRAPGAPRPGGRRLPGERHHRGHRDAVGRLQGRATHRRGRHPRDTGGVPGQGPVGDGQHLPHPAAGRPEADRRQRRDPPSTATGSEPGS
jgi:uncharacterized membrane-anchored protein